MAERSQLRNMTFNETFESSLVERNNEKFAIDKSLAQGIKENNVGKIIDNNQDGGVEDKKQLYDEYREIEGVVIDTRKRYDEVKTSISRTEQEIDKLKKKKELLNGDQVKYEEITAKQRADLQATKSRLKDVTETMQSTVFRRDIYDHMKDTLKKDILVLKKRYFDRDVELMRDKTKLKSLRNQHSNKIKLSKRCREMLETMENTVKNKQTERNSKIQSVHEVINRKQINQRNKQIRDREIEEVMISAMTDKLYEEKEWIKIMHTNVFLKALLKGKMESLMGHYHPVQLSFHKIKQATSVKDSNDFIERYFSKEENYGLLLEAIAEKEAKLEEVKEEREDLEKEHHDQLYKNQAINEEAKKVEGSNTNFQSVIEIQKERLIKISRQRQLMYGWGTKFLAAFNGDKNRDKVIKKYGKTQIKQLLIQVLQTLKKFTADLKKQANSEKKIEEAYLNNTLKNYTMSEENFEKNARIKSLSTYENEGADPFEDKDMAYDDLSEMDYLQHNRRAVKKNDLQNRRFRIKTKPY